MDHTYEGGPCYWHWSIIVRYVEGKKEFNLFDKHRKQKSDNSKLMDFY